MNLHPYLLVALKAQAALIRCLELELAATQMHLVGTGAAMSQRTAFLPLNHCPSKSLQGLKKWVMSAVHPKN